jgi:predicted RNase H-like nuclease (RuvC/YqgF family)
MPDDYEIMPHTDIIKLKKEIDEIKKNPFSDSRQNKTLMDSMEELTRSINSLVDLFKVASEELKLEEHDSVLINEKISPLLKKINDLEQQNEKIAKGIVALADMMNEKKQRPMRPMQQGQGQMMNAPMPPREPMFNQQMQSPELRPLPTVQPMPPPQQQQRKPLFSLKK